MPNYYRSYAAIPTTEADPGVLGTAAVAVGVLVGTWLIGLLYCGSKKGGDFCNFPCEPFYGICESQRVRVKPQKPAASKSKGKKGWLW